MLQLIPGYTLETLAESNIDNLLPFYYAISSPDEGESSPEEPKGDIVYRDGKPYKKIEAKDSKLFGSTM